MAVYMSMLFHSHIGRPEMEPHGNLQKKVANMNKEPKPPTGDLENDLTTRQKRASAG